MKLLPLKVMAIALMTSMALVQTSPVSASAGSGAGNTNSTFSIEQIDFRGGDTFGFESVGQAVNTIISVIFFLSALAAFFFILLGAFQYVTAGDDAGKTEKARKTITNAVVGLILVALVYVIWLIAIRIVPGLSQFFAG